jgi:very-short-patch-repair endonuclease
MQQNDLSLMRARAMRQTMTPAECALWHALRDRRFIGLKFRRQLPLGPYVADFYCAEHRLIIEADGGGHRGPKDQERDGWLASRGFRTLRFWNHDILTNLPGCLEMIAGQVSPKENLP